MNKNLEELNEYKNENVVRRFTETWDVPHDEALELFEDMKKWLWLSDYNYKQSKSEQHIHLAISQSTKLIDEMWHTFILFTRDYCEFCTCYFGRYLHHRPAPQSAYHEQIKAYESNRGEYMARQKKAFADQYGLIHDLLGEDVLIKWYKTYLEKYSDEKLQKLWRWSFSPYDTRVKSKVRIA